MINTIKNLAKAFIGESMARNRYTLYSEIADSEGYSEIAEEFMNTANQEKLHAKLNFKLIIDLAKETSTNLSDLKVETDVPTSIGSTRDILKAAINGETHEYTEMYPKFAVIAEKEGYPNIASKFRAIAKAEENHAKKYKALLEKI